MGFSAPIVIERLSRLVPLPDPARDSYAFGDSVPMPSFRAGSEPPYAKVLISSRSARVITALSEPDIPEAIAADSNISLSEARASLGYLVRRGYVRLVSSDDSRFQLTTSGEVIRRRIVSRDPAVVIRDSLSGDELREVSARDVATNDDPQRGGQ